MISTIHARSEDALRNGSFWHQRTGKGRRETIAQYMNGDFIRWWKDPLPADLQTWRLREAKKILPKGVW